MTDRLAEAVELEDGEEVTEGVFVEDSEGVGEGVGEGVRVGDRVEEAVLRGEAEAVGVVV